MIVEEVHVDHLFPEGLDQNLVSELSGELLKEDTISGNGFPGLALFPARFCWGDGPWSILGQGWNGTLPPDLSRLHLEPS